MREEKLREYFVGTVSANELTEDVRGSVVQVDDIVSTVQISDMAHSFPLARPQLVHLCENFLDGALSPETLSTIAFVLLASDKFEWDDDVVSEVISDWSAPEINYELNPETISMHRGWLLGHSEPPGRTAAEAAGTYDHLVSKRIKSAS
jgi:hypothetical protein